MTRHDDAVEDPEAQVLHIPVDLPVGADGSLRWDFPGEEERVVDECGREDSSYR